MSPYPVRVARPTDPPASGGAHADAQHPTGEATGTHPDVYQIWISWCWVPATAGEKAALTSCSKRSCGA